MIDSIINDLKQSFKSGHMVNRLIIINIGVYMVMALIEAFAPSFYNGTLIHWLALPSSGMKFFTRPWTIFTHMFIHAGFWHVAWNMLILHWFGRIVGDLIGDRHILPLYLLGGIVGGTAVLMAYQIVPQFIGVYAVGASAAVMAIVIVAGLINPDHEMRLLLIGSVKIKFIVLAIIFFDLIGIGNNSNTGGHIAHIAGMGMGWYYLRFVGSSKDLGHSVDAILDRIIGWFDGQSKARSRRDSPLSVKYKSEKVQTMTERRSNVDSDMQKEVDDILDKIKQKGYESLTEAEKETLFKASKK